MRYHFIVKTGKQLKKKHYFDINENVWWKDRTTRDTMKDRTYLFENEDGLVFKDMKRTKGGFESTITEYGIIFIPTWAIHRFLDEEKDSMHFI